MISAKQIFVYGRVQGVGFRFFTYRLAIKTGITGSVRNRPEGSVEIHAEGEESQLRAFLDGVRIGPKMAVVENTAVFDCPARYDSDFRIER